MPYIPLLEFHVGPLTITSFGILLAIGVMLGLTLVSRRGRATGLDERHIERLGTVLLLSGWLGAHWFAVLWYQPRAVIEDPLELLKVWQNISSFGGLLGATIGFFIYTRRYRLHRLRYADAFMYGALGGWVFGRAGCAAVHDHQGAATDFFLAVDFPEGTPFAPGRHHDLGLYEMFFLLALFIAVTLLFKRPRRTGRLVATIAVCYAPIRFSLEFMRLPTSDPRYWGLTPGQYASIATMALGLYIFWLSHRRGPDPAPAIEPAPSTESDPQPEPTSGA